MNDTKGGDSIPYQKRIRVVYWVTLLLGLFGFISIVTKNWATVFDSPKIVWLNPFALTSIALGNLFGQAFFDSFFFLLLTLIMVLWPLWFLIAYRCHRRQK